MSRMVGKTVIHAHHREGYFNGNDGGDENKTITDTGQNLLWVHQSKWQLQLLGNTISLIDATYK